MRRVPTSDDVKSQASHECVHCENDVMPVSKAGMGMIVLLCPECGLPVDFPLEEIVEQGFEWQAIFREFEDAEYCVDPSEQ